MRLSIVSDEISNDFKEASRFGMEWGIRDFEIRHLNTGRIPFISNEEIEALIDVKEQRDINISAISPGLFRIALKDEFQLKMEIEEHIYEAFRLAEQLETRNVVIYGFKKYHREPQTNYVQVVNILGRMATLAEKYGFNLLLENCPEFWACTGADTAMILDDVNSSNLKASWNLTNAAWAGEIPYPYGYLAIRKHIHSIHVNDFLESQKGEKEIVAVGDGRIDWKGQFRAILFKSNVEFVTIETQCKPLIETSHRNLLRIINILEDLKVDEQFIVK